MTTKEMLTQEQKKQIERDILKHKNPYDNIEDFTWEGDSVIFHGSILIRKNETLNAPQLISIERDNIVLENATFNAPQLRFIGSSNFVRDGATFNAPQLKSIGGDNYIRENAMFNAPKLTSIGCNNYIRENATFEAPKLISIGRDNYVCDGATFNSPRLTYISGGNVVRKNATFNAPELISIGDFNFVRENAIFEAPKLVNINFVENMKQGQELHGFIKADEIGLPFNKKRKHKGYIIYVTPFKNSNYAYVVTNGTHFAHCREIKQGILDIAFKSAERNMKKYRNLGLDHKLTYDEAITMYRVITGACSGGIKQFLSSHPELTSRRKYSIREVIDLTKGQYGSERLQEYFNV